MICVDFLANFKPNCIPQKTNRLFVVLIRGCVCYTRPVNASRLQPLSYMEAEETAGCTGNVVLYIYFVVLDVISLLNVP